MLPKSDHFEDVNQMIGNCFNKYFTPLFFLHNFIMLSKGFKYVEIIIFKFKFITACIFTVYITIYIDLFNRIHALNVQI